MPLPVPMTDAQAGALKRLLDANADKQGTLLDVIPPPDATVLAQLHAAYLESERIERYMNDDDLRADAQREAASERVQRAADNEYRRTGWRG